MPRSVLAVIAAVATWVVVATVLNVVIRLGWRAMIGLRLDTSAPES